MKQAGPRIALQLLLALAAFAFLMFGVDPVYATDLSAPTGCTAILDATAVGVQ